MKKPLKRNVNFKLLRTRRGKLSFLTRKRNEIETCIQAGESKEVVSKHMETFNHYLEKFMELQVSVQNLIVSEDEREADHTDWYEPKLINLKAFIEHTYAWMSDGDEAPDDIQPEDSVSQVASSPKSL